LLFSVVEAHIALILFDCLRFQRAVQPKDLVWFHNYVDIQLCDAVSSYLQMIYIQLMLGPLLILT